MNLTQVVSQLRASLTNLETLTGVARDTNITQVAPATLDKPRRMTVAGRRSIATAQKARWAKNRLAKSRLAVVGKKAA